MLDETSSSAVPEAPFASAPFFAPPPRESSRPGAVPTFSVVVAAYQAADSIGDALASVAAQTVPPLETIVVDDGSSDDLEGAVEPYRDRISLIRQENRGHAAAKNRGAQVARGDFIAILDADDAFMPERLEALGRLASLRPDLDLLVSDLFFEVQGRMVGRYFEHNVFAVEDQRRGIIAGCFVTAHPAIRRTTLLAQNGFDEAFGAAADWECYLRLIFSGSRAGLVTEPLLRYRMHEGAMTSRRAEALLERVRMFEKHLANPALSDEERAFLVQRLTAVRRRARLAEAEGAIRGLLESPRTRLATVVRDPSLPLKERARAAAAFISPAMARHYLEWRDRHGRRSLIERPMDRWLDGK
jgi:hypothetical protein